MPRIIIYSALVLFLGFTGYRMFNDGQPSWGTLRDTVSAPFAPKETRPFSLVDQDGNTVTDENYRGQTLLVFFGYTHCPDVCPTGLMTMAEAMEALGEDADKVTPVFITVDPARDRPDALKEYVANFHDRMVGLTGTEEQIAAAAKVYKAGYVRLDDDDGDEETYFMGHTSTTYLTGPDGTPLTTFAHESDPVEMAEAIRGYLR